MDLTGAGTAIMIAIAAALWFAYFVPTWMRRREYLDTERTATRLQQTLRVMAETAELPEQARALELNAKEISRLRRRAGRARAGADGRLGSRVTKVDAAVITRLRRRRAHRLASLLMVASTLTIAVQLPLAVITGLAPGGGLVLGTGAALGIAGVAVRRRLGARKAPHAAADTRATTPVVERAPAVPVRRGSAWTPIPVPKPLYLGRPQAQTLQPAPDAGALLRAAALAAEQELRAAHDEPEVVPFRPQRRLAPQPGGVRPGEAPARSASPSPWAAMGRVEPGTAAAPDLDEVLRRRRNAG